MTDSSPIADRRLVRRPDCPPEDALRELAAGLTPPDQATPLIQHVAQCDHCGRILKMYAEDFSDDLTPEDQAVLSKLKSASPEWQKKLVRKLLSSSSDTASAAAPSRSIFKLPWYRWLLVPATAAAVAAVAFFIWYERRDTPEKVEKLLAQAYTEQRTMELRWPGAAHSDFKQKRGENTSRLNSPEALRKAESAIASQLKKDPDNPRWLMLSAQLDLLDWHYKPALETLDRIDHTELATSPELLGTRAIALLQKAEELNEAQLYGQAVDLLGQVLQKNPNDPVALFNQALACEKISADDCALSDWERLISAEPVSSWAAEAQQHKARIEEKKTLAH